MYWNKKGKRSNLNLTLALDDVIDTKCERGRKFRGYYPSSGNNFSLGAISELLCETEYKFTFHLLHSNFSKYHVAYQPSPFPYMEEENKKKRKWFSAQ